MVIKPPHRGAVYNIYYNLHTVLQMPDSLQVLLQ